MAPSPSNKGSDGQLETLDDLSEAVHYNRWIFGMMEPHLGRRVLEVGCGIGNLTRLLGRGRRILGVDIEPRYIRRARENLRDMPQASFRKADLEGSLRSLAPFKADTVVCINVLEHIESDGAFLRNCFDLLPPGGKVLIFVPALSFLYGTMDRHYGHHRRYSRGRLEELLRSSGFGLLESRYLNLLGVLGWWWNGKVAKKRIIPKAQILLYDRILRYVVLVERFLPRPLGLSLFCAGVKAGPAGKGPKP